MAQRNDDAAGMKTLSIRVPIDLYDLLQERKRDRHFTNLNSLIVYLIDLGYRTDSRNYEEMFGEESHAPPSKAHG